MLTSLITRKDQTISYLEDLEKNLNFDYAKIAKRAIPELNRLLIQFALDYEGDNTLSQNDEIYYFKNLKCLLIAKIKYYKLIQRLELKKPPVELSLLKSYYLKKLHKIKIKLIDYTVYQQYYENNKIILDLFFFTKNPLKAAKTSDYAIPNFLIFKFYTKSIALEMFRIFLKNKVKTIANKQNKTADIELTLKWTASKTDLIELIYALHAAGSLNNGKATLKEIVTLLQNNFQIDIFNYNRMFYEIKSRKVKETKYIDFLGESLLKKIKSIDNEMFT